MKGDVIGFDADSKTGTVRGHDGNSYDFAATDWRGRSQPQPGDVVDFLPNGPHASTIYLITGGPAAATLGRFYLSPHGRISRSQFWLTGVLPIYGTLAVFWILVLAFAAGGSTGVAGFFAVLFGIYFIVTLWPALAITIKRIHDRNKTGWLVLVPYVPLLLLVVFGTIGATAGSGIGFFGGLAIICMIAFAGIGLWFFIECGCLRGTVGDNRFGPDPVR